MAHQSPYDAVPYRGPIVPLSAPAHLALCSRWVSAVASPLQGFRVAELGCGDGANLLPLAFYNPDCTFVGIDSSRAHVDLARTAAACLRLRNVQFVLKDIRALESTELSQFDYAVVHGVYSWVPEDARDAILGFCQRRLSEDGLAYISYNAQPGWATRHLVREILLRARLVREARIEDKAARAIELAGQLLEDLPERDAAYAYLLAGELERVRDSKPFYVLHEYLAEVNDGFWLTGFVEHARRHRLDYVADAQFCRWDGHIPPELKSVLAVRTSDPIEQEEAADLLRGRYFRASILCRAGAGKTPLSRAELFEAVHVASALSAESEPFDLTDELEERFHGIGGPDITLSASITKAAVVLLAAIWPRGVRLSPLFQQAASLLTAHGREVPAGAKAQLSDDLAVLFEAGQIDLRLCEPECTSDVPNYPEAHALARFEAGHRDALTTPYHLPILFEPQALALIREMDGSRSRAELQEAAGKALVDRTLETLGKWGLLQGKDVCHPQSATITSQDVLNPGANHG